MNNLRIFIVSALPRLSDVGLQELRAAVERQIRQREEFATIARENERRRLELLNAAGCTTSEVRAYLWIPPVPDSAM